MVSKASAHLWPKPKPGEPQEFGHCHIRKLNELFHSNIEVFKRQNSGVVGTRSKILDLHKYGLRKLKTTCPNGRKVISKAHRWEHWREIEKTKMLHLNDDQRALVGQIV